MGPNRLREQRLQRPESRRRYQRPDPLRAPDSAEGRVLGDFAYADFRDLFASIIEAGAGSDLAALRQAMLLEELGIIYLKNLLAHTDNEDLVSYMGRCLAAQH